MTLNRNSPIPFYYQIRQQLLEQIRSGDLAPGQPIPSEHEISAHFGVSRMTARQAMKSLCDEGVAYSRPGLGTFVSSNKQAKTSTDLLSFTQEIKANGGRPGSRVLAFEEVTPDGEVAAALHLGASAKAFRLKRVRTSDSSAMSIEESFLSAKLCPGLLEAFDPRLSLYQVLAESYGIRMTRADEIAEASLASAEDAHLLQIKKNSPVFVLTRISYAGSSEPAEFVRSIYRGDRWKLVSRLTAGQNSGSTVARRPVVLADEEASLSQRGRQRAVDKDHRPNILRNSPARRRRQNGVRVPVGQLP